ncbi:MAG: mechanosensitive ion channel [Bacteroidales bacterium]|nr:mechanosensitive ion channel [Bacteroidales bacterium]
MDIIREILNFQILSFGKYVLEVHSLIMIVVIFLITKLILWLIKKSLLHKRKSDKLQNRNLYSLYQIIKYVIWIIAIGLILDTIGINLTVLIAGSAALLVGIGLGLQQTFNDIISGIILLIEGSTKVGDILEVEDDVVILQNIGLRTSSALNRDNIVIILPNSLITTGKVINWSHQSKKTRFTINIGVAYGSDIDLVEKILKESAYEHKKITDKKLIEARFVNFGESSLDFQLLFYSEDVFIIEKIKSDIRKIINKKFIENKITIPFPQLDMHLKDDVSDVVKE